MRKKNFANNFRLFFLALIVGVFVFGNHAEAQIKRPKKKTTQKMKQSNARVEYQPDADLLRQMQAQICIVESKKDWKQFERQRPIFNKSGSRAAYLAQFAIEDAGEALIDVIVVYEESSDKFYEIRGFDFPRPFDELKWLNDSVLEFEQWVNPNSGGRYAVNVQTGKVVSAGYLKSK